MRSRSATARLARAAGASHCRMGPHPHALSLGDSAPRSGRRRFSLHPARWTALGALFPHGPHPHPLSLGDSAPRSGRRRFSTAHGAPSPIVTLARRLRASLGPQALLLRMGPHPHRALARRLRASLGPQALLNAHGAHPHARSARRLPAWSTADRRCHRLSRADWRLPTADCLIVDPSCQPDREWRRRWRP